VGLEPSFSRNTPAWPFAGPGVLPLEPSDPALAIPRGALQVSLRDILEQGSIAGIDPELPSPREHAPGGSAVPALKPTRKWPIAVAVSCLLHACVAMVLIAAPMAWYAAPDAQTEIEGADQAGLMVVGNADSDQLAAGDTTQVTLVPMVDAKPIEIAQAEAIPVEPASQPVEEIRAEAPPAETVEPVKDTPSQPVAAETVVPGQPAPENPAPEILTAQPQPPDDTDNVVRQLARLEPVEPLEERPAAAPQPEETVEPEAVPTPAVVAVLPQPRPMQQKAREKKPEPVKVPEEKVRPQEMPAKKKAKAGSGGASQADSKRGVADGNSEGQTAIASSGGARSGTGNAAVSNYPGKVAAKLRRVARTISRAAQASARSNAQVSFVVGAGGDVRSVQLVRSSGSPGLDEAALSIIRRAAPFPPIPPQAERTSWAFTLPIGPF